MNKVKYKIGKEKWENKKEMGKQNKRRKVK